MINLWAALILFMASFIHGLVGFAFALIGEPLLCLLWPLKKIVPLMALLGFLLNALLLYSLRRHFQLRRVYTLLLGALPGVVIGAFFLSKAPENLLRLLLGLILILYALWGMINPRPRFVLNDRWGYVFGFWAGALGGALNTPGPPVVIYVTLKGWDKEEVKSTLQGYFLLLLIFIIGAHWWRGLLQGEIFLQFFKFAPLVILGLFLGHRLYYRLTLKIYLRLLYLMLLLSGLLTLKGV